MSYILDALKKSEQERGQGSIPNVQTVHSSSLNYGNEKNTYWPYILIAAILLNFIAITYFIFDKEKTLDTDNSLATIEKISDTREPQVTAKKMREIAIENTTEEKPERTQESYNGINVSGITNNVKSSTQKSSVIQKSQTTSVTKPAVTKKTRIKDRITETKKPAIRTRHQIITDYYDLSDSMKSKLQPITVSAHVYSTNPLQRSVVINDKFMEEGEYISNKLMLHEITQDGAIFDYEGDLINYSIVSKWQ